MNENEMKEGATDDYAMYPDLRSDLYNFEERYRYLLRTTSLLYQRGFHIAMSIFMTLVLLLLTFVSRRDWYSYALCLIALLGIWYVFYSTDLVRAALKQVPQDGKLPDQMRMRKVVLEKVAELRVRSSIQSMLTLMVVLSCRSAPLWYSTSGIIVLVIIVVMMVASIVYYQRKITEARMYLRNILDALSK